jgi:signal transduction histidine kinase
MTYTPGTSHRGVVDSDDQPRMSLARVGAVIVAALAAGAAVAALELTSHHRDAKLAWAVFGPVVGWSFVGTGLYVVRRRPERRIGALMILLGFAWFLFTLDAANSRLVYTFAQVAGGLWGALFLHLGLSFPTGRLRSRLDRVLVGAGYVVFPFASVPALLFGDPEQLGCGDCPENLLLVRSDDALAAFFTAFGALLYFVLFVIVLTRAIGLWRRTGPFERLQLTPVYVCSLLTFLLVTVARAGAGDAAWWAAFVATGLLPLAFLGGLLRSHVSNLDAELQARMEQLRASRARLVTAGDAARRRLERDLHDGAQARLVALALLLRTARMRAPEDHELTSLLDRAQEELRQSLAELRELARGIHPAVLTERGLEPALQSLVARAPVPVTVEARTGERLPGPAESAAYFVVSEALANVAKYSCATHASVLVKHADGEVTIEVADDGVGGADAGRGSGLRGLEDRLAALDGTLSLESAAGEGTRLRARIPV